jgi:hypothetical protein
VAAVPSSRARRRRRLCACALPGLKIAKSTTNPIFVSARKGAEAAARELSRKGQRRPRMGLLVSVSRELTRQEVHHTFERIEAEGLGHRRPQVGVGVDVPPGSFDGPLCGSMDRFIPVTTSACRRRPHSHTRSLGFHARMRPTFHYERPRTMTDRIAARAVVVPLERLATWFVIPTECREGRPRSEGCRQSACRFRARVTSTHGSGQREIRPIRRWPPEVRGFCDEVSKMWAGTEQGARLLRRDSLRLSCARVGQAGGR